MRSTRGLICAAAACLLLSGCAALTAATGSLLGRGVNANVQAGAENRQAAVSVEGPRQSIRTQGDVKTETNTVRTERIETYNASPPAWVWLLLILGWLMPSPGEIWRGIVGAFRRR